MLFYGIYSRDPAILGLMKVAFTYALSDTENRVSKLVEALIKYHGKTNSRFKDNVLSIIREVCFGDVTIVNDIDAKKTLQVLFDVQDWPVPDDLQQPKKPLCKL